MDKKPENVLFNIAKMARPQSKRTGLAVKISKTRFIYLTMKNIGLN